MENKYIKQVGFNQVKEFGKADYIDDCIAFHTDIRELCSGQMPIRMDMATLVGCFVGRLQTDINGVTYTLRQNEVIVLKPNDIIANCMLSTDFNGGILCMSQRGLLEQISEIELWNKAFSFGDNPIVHVGAESLHMLELYGKTLKEKLKMGAAPYRKEIIVSIVKAALYELMASTEGMEVTACGGNLTKQSEVLFKRFIMLLSGCMVKPRSVAWYADQLCVTPKYLSTVCKQVSGRTAFDWINEHVRKDIRHWLRNSDKSIKEIADLLEFPNISFFGKYCRTHFGASPTDLRKQFREQKNDDGRNNRGEL